MTNEAKAQADINRGARAQALLDNDLLKDAFEALEMSYIQAWRSTAIHEDAAREKLFLAINVVGKVKQHLEGVVANGALAKQELTELSRLAEPRKRWAII